MNKILALFILISIGLFNNSYSQQNSSNFSDHLQFGGGIGLSIGNGFFSGTLAPSVLYRFSPKAALGLGLNATYNKSKDFYKSTVLGGSLIGLFSPIRSLQLSAEFEELHINRKYESSLNYSNDTYWYPALFLGAGYRNGPVTVGVRYDVLYKSSKSIYADAWAPFVRVYF